jgi:hypothetical protein
MSPNFAEGPAIGEQHRQSIAVGRQRVGAYGVQRQQDMIRAGTKTADLIFRCARTSVAHPAGTGRGPADEGAEGFERPRRQSRV